MMLGLALQLVGLLLVMVAGHMFPDPFGTILCLLCGYCFLEAGRHNDR